MPGGGKLWLIEEKVGWFSTEDSYKSNDVLKLLALFDLVRVLDGQLPDWLNTWWLLRAWDDRWASMLVGWLIG